jgi:hypothetical protein
MTNPCDCAENLDPRKLVRDGTHQALRAAGAPDPARVPVDERRPEHAMVFAAAYADYLRYYDLEDAEQGTWQDFFASDVSARLAVVAIEDVAVYRTTLKALLRKLEDPELPASAPAMIAGLGAVFDCLGTLAIRLDALQQGIAVEQPLRATLGNLIRSQLSPMLERLIGYYLAGDALGVVDRSAPPAGDVLILGQPLEAFDGLITGTGLSAAWPEGAGVVDWPAYVAVDPAAYKGAYGLNPAAVEQVNHLATHNLFTAICDTFLAVYARVVGEARAAVEATIAWNGHEPHYALFLAFLKLLEYARDEANTLTARHLEFYYRDVLRLAERPSEPGQAHVLVELAKHVDAHLLAEGTLLKAGKDDTGADAHFAVDRDLVANKAVVADLKRLYRHPDTEPLLPLDHDRLFAAPAANAGEQWEPFAEKVYVDGVLTSIAMPRAEVGFAIASHYLWMAEGTRRIDIGLRLAKALPKKAKQKRSRQKRINWLDVDLRCRLTTTKGWIEKPVGTLGETATRLSLKIELDGNDPPITPYDPAIHGYGLATAMPVLLVTLHHRDDAAWDYAALEPIELSGVTVGVAVVGLKTVMLSNDHGPIDASKPFLAYGAAPLANSALVVGSKEVFQKAPAGVAVNATLMTTPAANGTAPTVTADYLADGVWHALSSTGVGVGTQRFEFGQIPQPRVATPDLTPDAPFSTGTRAGFIRLKLSGGFGTSAYPVDLANWIAHGGTQPTLPVLPTMSSLTLDYTATQQLDLSARSDAGGRYFHVHPFGHAEQSSGSGLTRLPLLPRFRAGSEPSEGELYVGVRDLHPPQNLTLLFQVVDGTANPLVVKPDDHIHWTYLRDNAWVPFAADAVADGTNALLASGIVTLAVPADATTEHTLLPAGMHWIRLAVASETDAVCRLVALAAQALSATYVVRDNGSTSHTAQLPPGTITKLDPPDAAVKAVDQRFPTFGGRPVETTVAFATRVSERLRHKDRAIALWDYEHLILEAFPEIYQARCLNHTHYEPSATGTGIYRELAPGHVTVVTIPDRSGPDARDPLRPFTSLLVLREIEQFLAARMSCFATLHVRNPQFEEVRVDLRVRLRAGFDETFHVNKLKREITEFLSPWAFRSDARPTFNGKVYKSVLVNFVEERPYVDFVTDVHLFHRLPGITADGPDLEEAAGSRAISILVSVPAAQHGVHAIHADQVALPEHCACAPAVT